MNNGNKMTFNRLMLLYAAATKGTVPYIDLFDTFKIRFVYFLAGLIAQSKFSIGGRGWIKSLFFAHTVVYWNTYRVVSL